MRTCSTCSLIVVEPDSHWGPVLRSALAGRGLSVVECRSLAECEQRLTAFPWSVAALFATLPNSAPVIAFLAELRQRWEHAWGVGLVSVEATALEPLLREAGAVDVLCSVVQADRLVRLALRQAAAAPPQRCSDEAWLEELLPWGPRRSPQPGSA